MCGWKGVISGDYCIVRAENLGLVCNFTVTIMSESIHAMKLRGYCTRVPDHSLLQWNIMMNDIYEGDSGGEASREGRGMKYVVPENYLKSKFENIMELVNSLRSDKRMLIRSMWK